MSYRKTQRYPVSHKAYAPATNQSSYNSGYENPFGPGMAENVFGGHDYGDDDFAGECVDEYRATIEDLDPENLFNGELQSFHFHYQEDLDLETNEERERNLRNSIRRFERAYRTMSLYALKWHYLLEEVEENPQVAKMFKDMQMVRKLGGSDRV